jgi:hypothetical protein
MYQFSESPVKDVTFGEGMNISFDHYYELLKNQTGSLGSKEFLQIKLVADGIDISPNTEQGSYKWFSYYNFLRRADLAINPVPIDGTVLTGVVTLVDVYGKFLRKLRTLVVRTELSADEQKQVADLDMEIQRCKDKTRDLFNEDSQAWKTFCEIRGINPADGFAYVQWSRNYGQINEIENVNRLMYEKIFDRKTILNRKYPTPEDKEIIDAEFEFDNATMRLRYPIHPDFEYLPTVLTLQYLALLSTGSTAVFDDRHVVTPDKTLEFLKTAVQGKLTAEFDKQTQSSNSIETDWSASASARYGFIKVKANASEHKTISEDFSKATNIKLGSEASLRVNINYGPWFKPNLFEHKRVKDNPTLFTDFFGNSGTLLYYPTALILIRGFNISFTTKSLWTYDYKSKFSASGGGGLRAFGINFGGSASYGRSETIHKVDQSKTELKISDDIATLRFVGYVVKKNDTVLNILTETAKSMEDENFS